MEKAAQWVDVREDIKMPHKRKRKSAAKAPTGGGLKGALTGRSGLKGGLMGGAKAGKGKPAKQRLKPLGKGAPLPKSYGRKKKTKKKVRGTQSTRRGY